MIKNLPQPTSCPFCHSVWEANGQCSGCFSQYQTTLTIELDEDWDWHINITMDNIEYTWYGDHIFFIDFRKMDYFPPFNLQKLQTLINFS